MKWHINKPEEGEGVIVAVSSDVGIYTHLLTAAWDGEKYVDVNGDIVYDVIAWTELPKYGRK